MSFTDGAAILRRSGSDCPVAASKTRLNLPRRLSSRWTLMYKLADATVPGLGGHLGPTLRKTVYRNDALWRPHDYACIEFEMPLPLPIDVRLDLG